MLATYPTVVTDADFAREVEQHEGVAMVVTTSIPVLPNARGRDPDTSAKPPVFANGATSLEQKRIFNPILSCPAN